MILFTLIFKTLCSSNKLNWQYLIKSKFKNCDVKSYFFGRKDRTKMCTLFRKNSVARNCAELCATVLVMRGIRRIAMNCAKLRGNYRARNCVQVKSTCVRIPR